MAWIDIANGETYESIRLKLNASVYSLIEPIKEETDKIPTIKTETDKIPATITKVDLIKTQTDKIPTTITKVDLIKVETDKIPDAIIKIDSIDAVVDLIKTETDKVPATIAKVDLIKAETDKIPATITKVDLIKVETDKIPATITKVDTIVSRSVLPAQNTSNNNNFSDVLGNKTDTHLGDSIYAKLEKMDEHIHSRTRTYPYLAAGISLAANNSALTMGNIVEIVPVLANEVNTLTINSACSQAGNITIDLNGIKYTVPVSVGDANAVAAQLRGYLYNGGTNGLAWTISGSNNVIIFTRAGLATTGVLSNLGTTGVTGTFVKTNTGAGINQAFDIHSIQIGLLGNADTYILTLYSGLAGYEERVTSRRVTIATNNQPGGEVPTQTLIIPAGTRISASLACVAGGASKTAVVSILYHTY